MQRGLAGCASRAMAGARAAHRGVARGRERFGGRAGVVWAMGAALAAALVLAPGPVRAAGEAGRAGWPASGAVDRKSTRLNSSHT